MRFLFFALIVLAALLFTIALGIGLETYMVRP